VRPRDLAVVAAVLLVAAFAIADAVRGPHSESTRKPVETTPSTTAPTPTEGAPEPPQGIPAPGTLVLTDAQTCILREFDVASGTEFPHGHPIRTDCSLSAAPVSGRVAVGVGGLGAVRPFRFFDLPAAGRLLGTYRARPGTIVWSADGQVAAWCSARTGLLTNFEGPPRRLPRCAASFAADTPVFLNGRSLLIRGRIVAAGRSRIMWVRSGPGAAWVVLLRADGVAERWLDDRRLGSTRLPAWVVGRGGSISPNGCQLAVPRHEEIVVLPLDCSHARDERYPGSALAWSPDGRWIAVAARRSIDFYRANDAEPAGHWRLVAASLAWSPD
jgi:hypothetical protein